MQKRDYQNITGGIALIFIGGFVSSYAAATLRLGTLSQMGPGMFPLALGVILTGFGLIIMVPALFRPGASIARPDVRALVAIIASLLIFVLMVRPFGLVPTILMLTLAASRADDRLTPMGVAILATCLCAVAALGFRVGLGLQFDLFSWPW